jgi:hypothetical protein
MSWAEDPLAVKVPPVIVRLPLIVELAETVRPPPVIEIGSLLVRDSTDSVADAITIAELTGMLMTASSAEPGTFPVLQLPPTSQDPPLEFVHWTVDRSWRFSRASNHGRQRRRDAGELRNRLGREE